MQTSFFMRVQAAKSVLQKKNALLFFIALAVVLTALYFIVSGTFLVSLMEFNATADPVRIALQLGIAVLAAFQLTLLVFFRANTAGIAGGVLGLFMTSCTICVPLWAYVFGFGSALGFLASFGTAIGMASIALLGYGIWRTVDPWCGVNLHGKKI